MACITAKKNKTDGAATPDIVPLGYPIAGVSSTASASLAFAAAAICGANNIPRQESAFGRRPRADARGANKGRFTGLW